MSSTDILFYNKFVQAILLMIGFITLMYSFFWIMRYLIQTRTENSIFRAKLSTVEDLCKKVDDEICRHCKYNTTPKRIAKNLEKQVDKDRQNTTQKEI